MYMVVLSEVTYNSLRYEMILNAVSYNRRTVLFLQNVQAM